MAVLLAALAMFGPFSIDTLFPAFPAVEAEFGASASAMQQTLSIYLIAYAGMSLFHGAISDSLGRRGVILAGVGVFTLAAVGAALSTSLGMLLAFRVLQGLSAGAGLIVGRAIIRDLYDGPEAQKLMASISLLFGIAPAVAPLIGGWVLLAGTWRWIFWFLALWAGVLLLACVWRLPETHPHGRRQPFSVRNLLRGYAGMLGDRQFWPLAIAGTGNFSALFVYISAAPAFVLDLLHLDPQHFAWLFIPAISGMMLGAFLSGRLAGKVSAERTVGIGYAIMLGASALNLATSVVFPEPRLPWSVLPIGLHAIGISLTFPTLTLLLLDRFPERRGGVSSMQAFVSLLINAVLAGAIVVHLSDDVRKLAAGAAVSTVAGFVAWLVYRRLARRELARERAAGPEDYAEEAEPF